MYYKAVNDLFLEAVKNLPSTDDCEKAKKALEAIKKSIDPQGTGYGKFGDRVNVEVSWDKER